MPLPFHSVLKSVVDTVSLNNAPASPSSGWRSEVTTFLEKSVFWQTDGLSTAQEIQGGSNMTGTICV
jgi:hypothetical protein